MASPQGSEKIFSHMKIKSFDFDPDGTSAVDVGWEDMQNFGLFGVEFFRTIGTSVVTLAILANAQSNGGGTDVTVKTKTFTAQPDAVGDQVFLECTAEEVKQEANDAGVSGVRYVSASVSFATGTDEAVVTYFFAHPRFAYDQLTADIIA